MHTGSEVPNSIPDAGQLVVIPWNHHAFHKYIHIYHKYVNMWLNIQNVLTVNIKHNFNDEVYHFMWS